ncbi:MAG: AEC family transporter [Oscillospiraceae bacterium]|nr:AEC family transporter [Oscillospiraceae bacterium]
MEYFSAVLDQVLIFMMIMIVGFAVVKVGAIPESALPSISIIFAKIIIPAILFFNTVNGATREDMRDTLFLSGVVAIIYAVLISFMRLMPKILKLKGDRALLYSVMFTYGNVGFIGIPLLLALFGQRAMVAVTMFAIVDQLTFWTYGYLQTFPAGNRLKFTPKTLLKLFNPPIIAVIVSVILILVGVRVPEIINRAFFSVANAGLALPFIYIGGMLATIKDLQLFKRFEIYVGILLKMLVVPLAIFVAMTAAGIERDIAIATTILFGLPTIAMIPMLAGLHGSDEKYATATILVTTIASLFTLTFVTYVITVVL